MRKVFTRAVLLAALTVAAAACGGNDDSGSPGGRGKKRTQTGSPQGKTDTPRSPPRTCRRRERSSEA